MFNLDNLFDASRPSKTRRKVGRGRGSGRGHHSGRGIAKGDSTRSGWKKRAGYEGGQVPLYRKLPIRGFTRGRFLKDTAILNLGKIEEFFDNGETVSLDSLTEKGLVKAWIVRGDQRISRIPGGVKILGKLEGELTKKITIKADDFYISASAKEILEKTSVTINGTFKTK